MPLPKTVILQRLRAAMIPVVVNNGLDDQPPITLDEMTDTMRTIPPAGVSHLDITPELIREAWAPLVSGIALDR